MPWHLIVRVLFILAVTYAAVLVRPFTADLALNAMVGALLGLIIIGVETRLREAEVTDLLGALIGGAIGLGLEHVTMARIYLTHFERDYAELNAIWPSFFEPGKLPARTTVGVTALAVGALVEIDLVAHRP